MNKHIQQTKNHPLISVIMPVYNAGPYLVEAIESILNQSYQHFEFIIIDDASTDNSLQIIDKYARQYKNIRVIKNKKNLGVATATNKGIAIAKGDLIARMDADDITLPQRFEKQVAYLEKHPDVVAVGGQCLLINADSRIIGEKVFPQTFQELYYYSFRFIPFQQGSLMIARNRLPKNFVFYQNTMHTAEEVELIFKLFMYGTIANLPDMIHMYRLHTNNTSLRNLKKTFFLTLKSRIQAIFLYGYRPTFSGILINLAQAIIIALLPAKEIFALYQLIRNGYSTPVLLLQFSKRLFLRTPIDIY